MTSLPMPDLSTWPIDAIFKFAIEQYLKNVALCRVIEQLRTMNPNTVVTPKEPPNA